MNKKIAIIGGGIAGLAAAHRVLELDPALKIHLLESSSRLGGVIHTEWFRGCLIESGAGNFLTNPPAAVNLCERLGLQNHLIGTYPEARDVQPIRTGVFQVNRDGFFIKNSAGSNASSKTPLGRFLGLSRETLSSAFRKRHQENTELPAALANEFAKHRFEYLVQPLIQKTLKSSMDDHRVQEEDSGQDFSLMERDYGALVQAIANQQGLKLHNGTGAPNNEAEAKYGPFVSLREGMQILIDALRNSLPEDSIHLNSPAIGISRNPNGGWMVRTDNQALPELEVDALIIAAPAPRTAKLLDDVESAFADQLREVETKNCSVVSLGYARSQIQHPLDAVGMLIPFANQQGILSCSFSNLRYRGRTVEGMVLIQTYLGGTSESRLLQDSDDQVLKFVKTTLSKRLRIIDDPIMENVTRRVQPMPQYHPNHRAWLSAIDQRLEHFPTLALAGSAVHGVGIPACVASGEQAAAKILKRLDSTDVENHRLVQKENAN